MPRRLSSLALLLIYGLPPICRCSHYETLGVPRDATTAKIKSAYRKAALREHPDKQSGKGAASRSASALRMERLNEAYATLLDPDLRRRYNLELANPYQQRSYQSYESARQYEPRIVKVTIPCTLEQLGGFESVVVDLRQAFGLPADQYIPPLRVFLPPGSRSGDRHRFPLPHMGAVLVLTSTFEVPHARYTWSGDGPDLATTVHLPSWHNRRWWRHLNARRTVRVRSICGGMHDVLSMSEYVAPSGRRVHVLLGLGLPVKTAGAAGKSPYTCARGELRVRVQLRTPQESAVRCSSAASAAVGAASLLLRLAPLLWRRRVAKRILSVWTGPGRGIGRPFRIWGKGATWYAYKEVYS